MRPAAERQTHPHQRRDTWHHFPPFHAPVHLGAEEISRAIVAVARGEAALDHAVQHHVIGAVAQAEARTLPDGLTPREAEVLVLIAEGLSNQEIADRLVVSPATVKSHVNRVFAKAGVRDRAQAVAYAYRSGLAPSP
jgi:DNA-binding NarL/FixJ family response regulator